MDQEMMKAHEEKLKELHNTYKKKRRKDWLIWAIYNIIADSAIIFFLYKVSEPVCLVVLIMSTLGGFITLFHALKNWNEVEARQEYILQENRPMEKFKFD